MCTVLMLLNKLINSTINLWHIKINYHPKDACWTRFINGKSNSLPMWNTKASSQQIIFAFTEKKVGRNSLINYTLEIKFHRLF